ncbi:MAG: hypothetical protein K6E34_03405 [Lachnospiraceae bacterium]|nr:hypothetical protein [Lachnospiraceae bacterium]
MVPRYSNYSQTVRRYLEASTEKIMAVGGLRGTGKTVGILQAGQGSDLLYVLAQKDDGKTGGDYISLIKDSEQKCIVIDEYSWIKDREGLDRYLLTAVQNGKRIVITGTESITLDYLNYGRLIHRVDMIHTTMFPYDEYRRVYGLKHSQEACDAYLIKGGVFEDYAMTNYESMKSYVESAIVDNLAGYLEEIDEETARTLTYSILFKAICPSNLSTVPVLRDNKVMLDNFLDTMGVNTDLDIDPRYLRRTAEIFEQAGIIVRVPNLDQESPLEEQYYITNPSLTCQLIKAAYGIDMNSDILGHVFEASIMVQLSMNKLSEHQVFFVNSEGQSSPKKLDIVITDREWEHAYFFECKHMKSHKLKDDATLLSGYIENRYLPGADIDGRYVIYNGEPCVKEYGVGDILFIPPGSMLDNYFAFKENVENTRRITRSPDMKGPGGFNMAEERKLADSIARKVYNLKQDISQSIALEKERVSRSFERKAEELKHTFSFGR